MDALDFRLLDEFQRDFPVCRRPYAELASRLGVGCDEVLHRLRRLSSDGKVSRIGPVFSPRSVGASCLVAQAVPAERLAAVAATVNAFPGVNHNYVREHHFNLWFVLTAADARALAATLADIERQTGLATLRLPMLEAFHIDLGFALGAGRASGRSCATVLPAARPMDPLEWRLVALLQEGLALSETPYALLAEKLNLSEPAVHAYIEQWLSEGVIKRFGVVVRHRELGFTANAMLVHDIPDDEVGRLGRALGGEAAVSLCYRRARRYPDWPYNLFCMLHGRERGTVEAEIARLREQHGLQAYPHAVLFSSHCFKQTGARYA